MAVLVAVSCRALGKRCLSIATLAAASLLVIGGVSLYREGGFSAGNAQERQWLDAQR